MNIKILAMTKKCRTSLFTVVILPLLINGCASFEERPLIPAKSLTQIEARNLSNVDLQEFIKSVMGERNKSWNTDSLTLAAMYYHPDLALARSLADEANAAMITAGQRQNPSISISPTWISNLATAAAPWIFASSLSIPIETAGKRDLRMSKTEHLTQATRFRIADAVWIVRGRLRLAFLEVYAAKQAELLLQQQLQIEQKINEKLIQQLHIGEISRVEITREELALNQLQLNLASAQKRVEESRVLLSIAIGIPVATLNGIEFDFSQFVKLPDLTSIPTAQLRTTALHERPDLLAALADYEASQSALELEIANQYPNIQANPSYAWEMGEHRWSLGATNLQLPILHQNQGAISEAAAKRFEMEKRFETLQLKILGEIDKARAAVTAVLSKVETAEKQRQNQQVRLQSIQTLLQAGEVDALTLLTAELENVVAQQARINVLIESQQVVSMLEDTLRYPITSTFTAESLNKLAIGKHLQ